MYYGNEVRDFKQVPKNENVKISATELELGVGLIDRLTTEEFKPENYKDEYRIRVLGMLDEKSKGRGNRYRQSAGAQARPGDRSYGLLHHR
jgi:non-homologous end joining protein Ku